jgi:hypothetical protein
MERMLAAAEDAGERPDLVFADHGFAGAAIEAGVATISTPTRTIRPGGGGGAGRRSS